MVIAQEAALAIFAIAVLAIVTRPYRVPESAVAVTGALLMIVAGAVTPAEAVGALAGSWNVFLYFLGMLLVAAVADQAGVFVWLAHVAAKSAGGSASRLLFAFFGLGVGTTVLFSNDATALMLTPVVYVLVVRFGLPPRPFAFTCALVANSASLLFPVANPANMLILDAVPMNLEVFWGKMLLPGAAALLVTAAGIRVLFRSELSPGFIATEAARPVVGAGFSLTIGGLILLAIGYSAASWIGAPLGIVAVAGAVLLIAAGLLTRGLNLSRMAGEVAWGIFPFLAGMLVLILGVQKTMLTGLLAAVVTPDTAGNGAMLIAAAGAALGSNVVNNLPMALAAAETLRNASLDAAARQSLAAAVLFGVDIGPNLTTIGSLSTMLWLLLLRRRGLEISALQYLRVGIVLTPPMLLAAIGMFWLTH